MDANKEPNWEKRLENLRQTRRMKRSADLRAAVPPLLKPERTRLCRNWTMQAETVC